MVLTLVEFRKRFSALGTCFHVADCARVFQPGQGRRLPAGALHTPRQWRFFVLDPPSHRQYLVWGEVGVIGCRGVCSIAVHAQGWKLGTAHLQPVLLILDAHVPGETLTRGVATDARGRFNFAIALALLLCSAPDFPGRCSSTWKWTFEECVFLIGVMLIESCTRCCFLSIKQPINQPINVSINTDMTIH